MKLLHTADLHVGDSRNLPDYLERQRRMLAWLTDQAIQHNVDAMLVCGDIYDTKHVLPRERDCLMEWLFDNDRAGLKHDFLTVMIGGNHDEIEAGYTHLHGLKRLMERGLLHTTLIVDQHARCLPLPNKLWVAALPAANYRGDELSGAVAALRASADLKLKRKGDAVNYFVVMAHEAVYGATNEAGTYRARGPKIDDSLDVTYWALGDIHKPYQQIAPNAWYPGSPIQHEFGDISEKRGALLVDLDDPCNPRPLQIEGVVPLITLYDKPDEWPTDAIVRFEGTAEEIADTAFPDNVVAFKPLVEVENRARETVAIDLAGYQLLEGLDTILADVAVPPARREAVAHIIRTTLETCRC